MTIRLLPENVINQIAAGEVVERPASVVKELSENAIDANAKNIDIVLRDGGQTLISVTDDGSGMTAENLKLAIERHATSKLPDDNLMAITTLGFRGEALPSIGAIARLSILSRNKNSEQAWVIKVNGGDVSLPKPGSLNIGTKIEVRDLFFATPARLKFLKTSRTEQIHCIDIIKRLAMAHPEIGWRLSDGARDLLKLPSIENSINQVDPLLKRLSMIMGKEFNENAMAINAERENAILFGYAGLPTLNRGNAQMQFLFVNGRPVKDKLLHGALRGAYRDFLASDRYPLVALFLDLPSEAVDINVHPAKSEVRFRDTGHIRGLIVGALKKALAEAGHRASTTVAWTALGAVSPGMDMGNSGYIANEVFSGGNAVNHTNNIHKLLPGISTEPSAPGQANVQDTIVEDLVNYPLGVARAQVHETYVVAQTEDGIVIVDQHAAHERLVHERIKHSIDNGGVQKQGILIPEVIELDEGVVSRLMDRADELAELGLVIESFGHGAVIVRETPAILGEVDVKGLVNDIADDLEQWGEGLALKNKLGDVCATMACHGSIRAGRKLNGPEMNALLREMESTPHSGQCSHGRPTYVELKLKDIEKLFGRR